MPPNLKFSQGCPSLGSLSWKPFCLLIFLLGSLTKAFFLTFKSFLSGPNSGITPFLSFLGNNKKVKPQKLALNGI